MGVPQELTKNAHVFCYSSDLYTAALNLATKLGCGLTKIYGGAARSSYNGHKIAWLVGHGSSSDECIGTALSRANALNINTIITDLTLEHYTHVVDTCCEPDKRRPIGTSSGLTYYSANDGQSVIAILPSDDLDTWWDNNNLQ